MSALSVVTIPCDRCGRHRQAEESGGTPFSFCSACGLFVCSTCWSKGESVCDACHDASEAATREAAPAKRRRGSSERRAKRGGGARKPPDGGRHVTSFDAGKRDDQRPTATSTAPVAVAVTPPPPEIRVAPRATPERSTARAGADLRPVGPGIPGSNVAPRWERRLPDPFVVRMANWITDGHAFGLIVATLVGLGVIVAAWAMAIGLRVEADAAPVLPAGGTLSSAVAHPATTVAPSAEVGETRYFVRRGDTLAKIAARVYGNESLWPVILEANRDEIEDPDALTTGTDLWIPPPPDRP